MCYFRSLNNELVYSSRHQISVVNCFMSLLAFNNQLVDTGYHKIYSYNELPIQQYSQTARINKKAPIRNLPQSLRYPTVPSSPHPPSAPSQPHSNHQSYRTPYRTFISASCLLPSSQPHSKASSNAHSSTSSSPVRKHSPRSRLNVRLRY